MHFMSWTDMENQESSTLVIVYSVINPPDGNDTCLIVYKGSKIPRHDTNKDSDNWSISCIQNNLY